MNSRGSALKALHVSRTFKTGPFNHIRNVRISASTDGLKHWVFKIPSSKLKSNAVKFSDFDRTVESASFRRSFTFFLDYIKFILGSIGNKISPEEYEPFRDSVAFLEWAHNVNQTCIGYRLHVFSSQDLDESVKLKSFLLRNHRYVSKLGKNRDILDLSTHRHMHATDSRRPARAGPQASVSR